MSGTTWYRSLTGRPQCRSRWYQPDCVCGGSSSPSTRADAVHDHVERPRRRDPRVLLPQRPGRGVARVGERRLARLGQPHVQFLERRQRQEHLAAHLEHVRPPGAGQPARHRGDGLDVRRHVLAGYAVAPGRGPIETALAVHERDRQPVDLELAQVRAAAAEPLGPGHPCIEVLGREHVVEAQQPLQVLDRREVRREPPADPLARRVRRPQLGDLLLDALQLAHHRVVVDVGDQRRVEHVVAVLVLEQLGGQLRMPLPGILLRHRPLCPSIHRLCLIRLR